MQHNKNMKRCIALVFHGSAGPPPAISLHSGTIERPITHVMVANSVFCFIPSRAGQGLSRHLRPAPRATPAWPQGVRRCSANMGTANRKRPNCLTSQTLKSKRLAGMGLIDPPRPLDNMGISGLVVEYIVAIDVTRVRFPADALSIFVRFPADAFSIFVRFPADALPIFYPPSLPLPLSLSCARADAYTARARAPARTVRGESRPGPGAGASRVNVKPTIHLQLRYSLAG